MSLEHPPQNGISAQQYFAIPDHALVMMEAQAYRLYRRGQYERAREIGLRIYEFDALRPATAYLFAELAMLDCDAKEAFRWYDRAITLGRQDALVLCRLGESLLMNGRQEEGIRVLHAAVQRAQGPSDPGRQRADAILRQDRSK